MTSVAIMQPTYLPGCGYLALMQAVDFFVFLDSVQFAKRSWQQRNQIKTPHGALWLSVPVISKGKRDQLINEVEIDTSCNITDVHRKSIEMNYARAPYFEEMGPSVLSCIDPKKTRLVDLNIGIAEFFCGVFGIKTRLLRSSDLRGCGTKADLLASLCVELDATAYISVPGSKAYLDESTAFEKIGVPVHYFNFQHPVYPQLFGDFLPFMSAIDLLFNCGERSVELLKQGIEVIE
jgi:hypothetical protein